MEYSTLVDSKAESQKEASPKLAGLEITLEVTPQERLQKVSELTDKTLANFSLVDSNKDNYLSEEELGQSGGFNRYLAKQVGVLSRNHDDGGAGSLSWDDLRTLKTISTGSDLEIRQRAIVSMMSTAPGRIGMGSIALTCGAEICSALRGVPLSGKLRVAGYAIGLGALAYGFLRQQDEYFSLKSQLAQDTDLNRYCGGTLNIDSKHFRGRFKLP